MAISQNQHQVSIAADWRTVGLAVFFAPASFYASGHPTHLDKTTLSKKMPNLGAGQIGIIDIPVFTTLPENGSDGEQAYSLYVIPIVHT